MSFERLPNELLENIITHALPEGFESLALTCKHLYTLCTPLIEHYNKLRYHFQDFYYYKTDQVVKSRLHLVYHTRPYTACSAFNLIALIAVEPVIARYIEKADFEHDGQCTQGIDREVTTNVNYDDAVVKLLANSPYLKEAGLDWRAYWAAMEEDLDAARYSQHAAAFALTLLPNVKKLKLPRWWKPVAAADKLVDAVVRKTRHPRLPYDRPSMAQVTKFEAFVTRSPVLRFDITWVIPFLALPHVQSFCGSTCIGMGGHRSIVSEYLDSDFESTLEVVDISFADVDWMVITDLLKHTPRLKKLKYLHIADANDTSHDWDLCRFITAIEHEVGSHLEKLCISIHELPGAIKPGSVSMRGFQRLRKLVLPLELVLCSMTPANHESLLSDLIPASVSQLSLLSHSEGHPEHHYKALDHLFHDFAARKDSHVPALEEIYLSYPSDADDLYEEQCDRLAAEAEKVGIDITYSTR